MASRKLLELALMNVRADPSQQNVKVYFQVAKSYWLDSNNVRGIDRDRVHYIVDYVNVQLDRIRKGEVERVPCGLCQCLPKHKVNGRHVYIVCNQHPHGINQEVLQRVGCRRGKFFIDLKEQEILSSPVLTVGGDQLVRSGPVSL